MEEVLKELVDVIRQSQNNFDWNTLINILSIVAAWITIAFLLLERKEKNRPYLQISFELIRSTLACITLRNVGNTPLKLTSIEFNEDFIRQLPESARATLMTKKNTNISIFPNQQWILCLEVTIPNIFNNFEVKQLKINYQYSKHCGGKVFKEYTEIDFKEYAGYLEYISTTDEFKRSFDKMSKNIKDLTNTIKQKKSLIP